MSQTTWENLFLKHRPFLVSFAFRMTGSLAEAEDLAQDTFLECAKVDLSGIENPKAWMTKVCSNKALDHLKQAYKKRETYPGTWLPDAVPESLQLWSAPQTAAAPDVNLLLSESLTTSFLLLIEKLSPEERAIYLLSEVFEYSFRDIAQFVGKSEDACRKTAERARKSVLSGRAKFSAPDDRAKDLLEAFFESAKRGDESALLQMLSEKSEFWSDGGGKVSAVAEVLRIPTQIAAFLKRIGANLALPDYRFEFTSVNSRPGVVLSKRQPDGFWTLDTIMSFEIEDGKIARVYAQRNPDKLKALMPETVSESRPEIKPETKH